MILFALGVIALGVSMWVWPDAVGDGTINGRRTLLKVIITNVWGPVTRNDSLPLWWVGKLGDALRR